MLECTGQSRIWLKPEIEEVEDQNEEIKEKFFGRSPKDVIDIEGKTGLRDMVEYGADYVDKLVSKRLNMEYDWKRRPLGVKFSEKYEHIAFSTEPWDTVEQFNLMRSTIEEMQQSRPSCIKTLNDFQNLSDYVEVKTVTASKKVSYIKKQEGDVKRLRQALCTAFKHKKAGLGRYKCTHQEFSAVLTNYGIKCTLADVENGLKRKYFAHQVPPTERVQNLMEVLKNEAFPKLDIAELLLEIDKDGLFIRLQSDKQCPFIRQVN